MFKILLMVIFVNIVTLLFQVYTMGYKNGIDKCVIAIEYTNYLLDSAEKGKTKSCDATRSTATPSTQK